MSALSVTKMPITEPSSVTCLVRRSPCGGADGADFSCPVICPPPGSVGFYISGWREIHNRHRVVLDAAADVGPVDRGPGANGQANGAPGCPDAPSLATRKGSVDG